MKIKIVNIDSAQTSAYKMGSYNRERARARLARFIRFHVLLGAFFGHGHGLGLVHDCSSPKYNQNEKGTVTPTS